MLPQPATAPRRTIETASIVALIATIVTAIFIVLPFTAIPLMTTKAFVLVAGALVTLAFYILARLGRGNIILPPLALVGAFWLPAVAYLLSAAFSGGSFSSALWGTALGTDTLAFVLTLAALGTLTALIVRRPDQYRSFLTVGAWVFGILILLRVLVLIVGQFAPASMSPAFSIVGSSNDLAFVLGLGVIAILLTKRLRDLAPRTNRLLLGSGAGALALLAVANSPVVWTLIALVALALFVEAVMRRGGKQTDVELEGAVFVDEEPAEKDEGGRSLILPLGVLVVALFFLIGGTLGTALSTALNANTLSIRPSWQSTLSIMNETYATAPVFGSGPDTFGDQWLRYRDASLNATLFWNLTFSSGIGSIPTSFVTTGIVGAVAWIAFLVLFLGLGMHMLLRRTPADETVRYVAVLSFVAAAYLFTVALFDVPSAVVLALAFVFAGVFASTMRYAGEGRQWGIIFSRSPKIGFVIVFVLTLILLSSVAAVYALIGRYIATADIATARAALSAGDLDRADKAVQHSVSFAQSAAAYQVEASVAIARLGEIVASTTMTRTDAQQAYQTALAAGINAALTATSLDSTDPQGWMQLGNLYAQAVPLKVSGAYESAKTAYDKARELDPTNPRILFTIAQLDVAYGDTAAAKEDLKAAISLKQDYTDAIFMLSQLEVQDGNVAEALAAALAAAYFTPNNPNILFQVGILSAARGDYAGAEQALAAAVSANPQFANARYFLAALYAKRGSFDEALVQVQAIASLSEDNASIVAPLIEALKSDKSPFPADLLSISSTPVKQ